MSDVDFQLKGSTVTVVVLEVVRYFPDTFPAQLEAKIQQAPQFFQDSPVLINLEKLVDDDLAVDLSLLIQQCRDLSLQPIAFKGVGDDFKAAVTATGLASLPDTNTRAKASELNVPEPASAEIAVPAVEGESQVIIRTVTEEKLVQRPSKVITRPVRSGQQVYAEGADLIVLSQVSEGAEVIADGHIHVYGALRGRALAGVRGDTQARVFCQKLEAEIISVAGNFLLSESLPESLSKQATQAYLDGDVLKLEAL